MNISKVGNCNSANIGLILSFITSYHFAMGQALKINDFFISIKVQYIFITMLKTTDCLKVFPVTVI